MDISYLTFYNSIDVFNGASLPSIIDPDTDAWPSERNMYGEEVDV